VALSLHRLATLLGVGHQGDGATQVDHVAPLEDADAGALSFLANKKYRRDLATTRASVVVVRDEWKQDCPCACLVSENPYLTFARAAALLYPEAEPSAGVSPSAVVAEDVVLPASVSIGPQVVIESGVQIGEGVIIGPGSVIGRNCRIGADSRLVARVTLLHEVILGERVLIQPGAVLGADGFGFANDNDAWVKVPQLGRVIVGNDVEIGANTCIDRGSLRDTLIADGVKLDNLIQIAHNVEIGEHSAIAACCGIAGSTRIGRYCTIAGIAGVNGHIELADRVHITGMSMVTRSLLEPGVYSGNVPAEANRVWAKNMAHLRRLDQLVHRVKELESRLEDLSEE
jgi:UDP-3-O-[3-hydroxymyristoyl] glucosamine N-acyltransferase